MTELQWPKGRTACNIVLKYDSENCLNYTANPSSVHVCGSIDLDPLDLSMYRCSQPHSAVVNVKRQCLYTVWKLQSDRKLAQTPNYPIVLRFTV